MKKLNFIVSISSFSVFCLIVVSCHENQSKSESDRTHSANHSNHAGTPMEKQLFGSLVIIVENYNNRLSMLEAKKKKNISTFEMGLKFNREMKVLKAEADSSIAKYINNFNNPLIQPVKQEGDKIFYNITEMIVENATLKKIVLRANVKILKVPLPGDTIYVQLYAGDVSTTSWMKFVTIDLMKVGNICRFKAEIKTESIIGVTKAVAKTLKDYEVVKREQE